MRVSFATRAGSTDKPSEDFAAANPRVVLVLDGLSSPPELGSGCVHGTPWFVARLGTQILSEATCRWERPLADCVADAITAVAAAHADSCDLAHLGTPSSSVAVVREGQETLEYLAIFDSVIVFDGPAGPRVVTDLRADDYAREEHAETMRHRIGTREHQRAVTSLVAAQRPFRNQPGGYWVAAVTPDSARNAVTGTVARDSVDRLAVLSDGASCLVDDYDQVSWPEFMDLLAAEGPERIIDKVRAAEAGDREGVRWPRYKRSDDSTVVYGELERLGQRR
ncbi:hypothetical protein C8D88_12358 [Lentzea atacamensis]|uniref:PPM-type phosphatase domain-containing protein n=1 Tax=Lentzea atacamensis TaxID=531938 RepID=A0A316HHP0_9PSEU|nr:protein phosphatase 2C domain-containing protein [Lentzea atacamensis]PWK80694.1 hypothetical protein C8D88_12358 [Lentzea atacamensis]